MKNITLWALLWSGLVQAAPLQICSFNIQFLGNSSRRDNEGLTKLLADQKCDIVTIQELVAPPSEAFLMRSKITTFESKDGILYFPSSSDPIKPAPKVTAFFEEMEKQGFADFIISEEDTGPSAYHTNGSASEWWVTFYKSDKVEPAPDLPHGFLSPLRVGKDREFERTPYAFPFRTKDGAFDFVLISVHLAPGADKKERRIQELSAIRLWTEEQSKLSPERDFITLGDMNIEDASELGNLSQEVLSWVSLNQACNATNTNPKAGSKKPYDHVMLNRSFTSPQEVPESLVMMTQKDKTRIANFTVIDLREKMAPRWQETQPDAPFPGSIETYQHDPFRAYYSDHMPIKFKAGFSLKDDD